MPDSAEITGATVIRLLIIAEIESPSGSMYLSEKCHRITVLKSSRSILPCYTFYKLLNLFTTNLKKSYRLLNPPKVSVQLPLFSWSHPRLLQAHLHA